MRCQVEWMLFAMGLSQAMRPPGGGIYGPVPCKLDNEVETKRPTKAIELLLEELPQLNMDVKPKRIYKRIDVPPPMPDATTSTPIPEERPMPPTPVTTVPPPPAQPTESKVVKHPEGPKSVCARSMAVGVVGYSILCEKRRLAKLAAATTTTTTTTTTVTPPPPEPEPLPESKIVEAPTSQIFSDPRFLTDKAVGHEHDRLPKQLESILRCANFRCREIDESLEP